MLVVAAAHALLKKEPLSGIVVFLMGDAVLAAKAGQKSPERYFCCGGPAWMHAVSRRSSICRCATSGCVPCTLRTATRGNPAHAPPKGLVGAGIKERIPLCRPDDLTRLQKGLRKAGLLE